MELSEGDDPENGGWGCHPVVLSVDITPGAQQKIIGRDTMALKKEPNEADTLEDRAEAYFNDQQFDLSAEDYARAYALRPQSLSDLDHLADSLRFAGKTEQAAARYREELAKDDHSANAYDGLGTIAYEAGRYDEALQMYSQAERNDFGNKGIRWKLVGFADYKLGRYRAAVNDFTRALSANKEVAAYRCYRGKAKLAAGDVAGGRADMAAAQKAAPDVTEHCDFRP